MAKIQPDHSKCVLDIFYLIKHLVWGNLHYNSIFSIHVTYHPSVKNCPIQYLLEPQMTANSWFCAPYIDSLSSSAYGHL